MTAGVTGATFYTSFTRRGLSSELVFESPNADVNLTRIQALHLKRRLMEAAYEGPLDWQELPGKKATRIADYLPDADLTDEDEWESYLAWLLDRQSRIRTALSSVGGIPEV